MTVPKRPHIRWRAGAAALVVAVASGACTGQTAVDPGAAPTTTRPPSVEATAATTTVPTWVAVLHFPRSDPVDTAVSCSDVYPVTRALTAPGDRAAAVVAALLAGPTEEEITLGFEPIVDGVAPSYAVRTSRDAVTVDFATLLDSSPRLAGACEGGRFRSAIATSLGELGSEARFEIGDAATFDRSVGVGCDLPMPDPSSDTMLVYFHCEGAVDGPPVAVSRPAPDGDVTTWLEAAIRALEEGPTEEEWRTGAFSAIQRAAANRLAAVNLRDGVATIDFRPGPSSIGGYGTRPGSVTYLDELLATVYQFPEVQRVEFTLDGSCDAFAAQFERECARFDRRSGTEALWTSPQRDAAERMTGDLAALREGGPRPGGSRAEQATGDWIVERLLEFTTAVETELVPLPTGSPSRNIWTSIGSGSRSILIGAHYDTVAVSPGIDDNGSGTVVLLELARRLAAAPPDDAAVTIAFFGAEEVLDGYSRNDHHFGSRLMADRLAAAERLPDLMVSADMIGIGDRLYAAIYRDADPAAAEALVEAAADHGVEVTLISRGDISDHEAFARNGVPSVFMWRPDNPAWHTAGDDEADVHLLLEDLAILETLIGAR